MSGSLHAAPGTIPQFSVVELTRSLNEVAPVPGLIGSLNLFAAQPQSTTIATIERRRDRLALVPEQPRGAPANRNVMGERDLLQLKVPHFPLGDTIMADSIQDVRGFGQNSGLEGWGHAVNRRLEMMGHHLDATLEHLRLGAAKGLIITVTDRETGAPLRSIDLFAHFGVVPQETVDFPMRGPGAQSADAAWNGRIMAAARRPRAASPPRSAARRPASPPSVAPTSSTALLAVGGVAADLPRDGAGTGAARKPAVRPGLLRRHRLLRRRHGGRRRHGVHRPGRGAFLPARRRRPVPRMPMRRPRIMSRTSIPSRCRDTPSRKSWTSARAWRSRPR